MNTRVPASLNGVCQASLDEDSYVRRGDKLILRSSTEGWPATLKVNGQTLCRIFDYSGNRKFSPRPAADFPEPQP